MCALRLDVDDIALHFAVHEGSIDVACGEKRIAGRLRLAEIWSCSSLVGDMV